MPFKMKGFPGFKDSPVHQDDKVVGKSKSGHELVEYKGPRYIGGEAPGVGKIGKIAKLVKIGRKLVKRAKGEIIARVRV